MRHLSAAELFLVSGGTTTLTTVVVTADPPPNPPSDGGGGGGSPGTPTRTGTHNVFERSFSSKVAGHNNPGNLVYNSWTANHGSTGKDSNGFAEFATEQDGRQALADLIDGNYGNSTPDSLSHDGYNGGSAAAQNAESNNLESYMSSHGYSGSQDTPLNSMGDDEFNTFLDSLTNAEGSTNM